MRAKSSRKNDSNPKIIRNRRSSTKTSVNEACMCVCDDNLGKQKEGKKIEHKKINFLKSGVLCVLLFYVPLFCALYSLSSFTHLPLFLHMRRRKPKNRKRRNNEPVAAPSYVWWQSSSNQLLLILDFPCSHSTCHKKRGNAIQVT